MKGLQREGLDRRCRLARVKESAGKCRHAAKLVGRADHHLAMISLAESLFSQLLSVSPDAQY